MELSGIIFEGRR